MSDARGNRDPQVVYNVDRILDAHTHLTGQENAGQILECLDATRIEMKKMREAIRPQDCRR